MKNLYLFGFAAMLASAAGCQTTADATESGAPAKPAVAFEGTTDEKYVGTWKTPDGKTTYVLAPDGKFTLKSKVSYQGRSLDQNVSSEWRAKDGKIIFKDASGNPAEYSAKLEGNKLTLDLTGKMRNAMVLVKQ